MKYWIVKGNPQDNDLPDGIVMEKREAWRTKRPPNDWDVGDHLFFWEGSPTVRVVGLGVIEKIGSKRNQYGEIVFWVRYTTDYLKRSPKIEELRNDPILEGASFLKQGAAGTVFPLTNEQAQRLFHLVAKYISGLQPAWNLVTGNLDQSTHSSSNNSPKAQNGKVFLVHGHNDHYLQTAARLLEKQSLKVVVLREQPNGGKTIIEKLLNHAENVDFAVVLLTGDDQGNVKGASVDEFRPRARQNVILELGLFLGLLGREKVCALYEPLVELPSDYSGVLFIELDSHGTWRYKLIQELKAANFSVDFAQIF